MTTKRPKRPPKPRRKAHIAPQLRPLAVPIGSLVLDPENARRHDRRNIEAVKASLTRFGQVKPVVVQERGRIVRAGNATVEAAIELGWTEIAANVQAMIATTCRSDVRTLLGRTRRVSAQHPKKTTTIP